MNCKRRGLWECQLLAEINSLNINLPLKSRYDSWGRCLFAATCTGSPSRLHVCRQQSERCSFRVITLCAHVITELVKI